MVRARTLTDAERSALADGSAGRNDSGPVWQGPGGAGPQGGITQGLIGRWLACRERFRVCAMEGLAPRPSFKHQLEYGNLWHTCERVHAAAPTPSGPTWEQALHDHALALCRVHRLDQEQIQHWHDVCRTAFPLYVRHWAEHPDVQSRTPLEQEKTFDVPLRLPSGRTVRLRGRWDSVDLLPGRTGGIFLQENKTVGSIDEERVRQRLTFDLQTMVYLAALEQHQKFDGTAPGKGLFKAPIRGVRYNVVRRPLEPGTKGAIVRHKPSKSNPAGESREDFYARLAGIMEGSPGSYFARWRVEVSATDQQRFRRELLEPVLESICDDWEWWSWCARHRGDVWDHENRRRQLSNHRLRHWRLPYGVWSPVTDRRAVDEYAGFLSSGSTVGLVRVDDLFPELRDKLPGA